MTPMVDTPQPLEAQPPGGPTPRAAAETAETTVPAYDYTAIRPATRRIDAGNTALLIGIIVGLIGSVSVLIGVPVFLLNEEVNRVSDNVEALSDKMDARFAAQDAKIEDLRRGQAEISRQLAVLVASLGRTAAGEG